MAVRIRLRRMGNNKKPFFRISVTDIRAPATGRFLETVGWYDPKATGVNFKLNLERIAYWVNNGAQLSEPVSCLMRRQRRLERQVGSEATLEAGATEPQAVESACDIGEQQS